MCAHLYTQWAPRKELESWPVSLPPLPVTGRGTAPSVTLKQVTPLQHPVQPHPTVYLLSFLLPRLCNFQTRPHVTDGAWGEADHAGTGRL